MEDISVDPWNFAMNNYTHDVPCLRMLQWVDMALQQQQKRATQCEVTQRNICRVRNVTMEIKFYVYTHLLSERKHSANTNLIITYFE